MIMVHCIHYATYSEIDGGKFMYLSMIKLISSPYCAGSMVCFGFLFCKTTYVMYDFMKCNNSCRLTERIITNFVSRLHGCELNSL